MCLGLAFCIFYYQARVETTKIIFQINWVHEYSVEPESFYAKIGIYMHHLHPLVERHQDVSVVRLNDILLERRDDVQKDVITTFHQYISRTS